MKWILHSFIIFTGVEVHAQVSVLDIGLRLQKDVGLYHENGISVNYSNQHYAADRLYFGFSYFTSRAGSALASNAVKQDNFLLSAAWVFRKNHLIRPVLRVNAGYFSSDYPAIFAELPHRSLLAAVDGGLCFQPPAPVKINTTFGYNLIYGRGNNDTPGTLYPLFYQITLSWNILK